MRAGAGVQVLCVMVCTQVWYAMHVSVYVILCATDYALCGTGRLDGVQVRGMRYADISGRAGMRYEAGEDCKMGSKYGSNGSK